MNPIAEEISNFFFYQKFFVFDNISLKLIH